MRIVEESFERSGPKATVVVEADNLEQVKGLEARNLALDFARKNGLSVPGFTGGSWTEWVDENGKSLLGEDFKNASTRLVRAHYPVQEAVI
jgi:hypothetical protein